MHVAEGSMSGVPYSLPLEGAGAGSLRLRGLARVVLSFEALVAACVLGLIAVAVPRTMADPDIWWHLRNAQSMLTQHAFVREDVLSFTAQGSPWIDHEWLAEIPFYLGWRALGPGGVYGVTVAAVEGIFAGVLFLCWRASRSCTTACVATVIAALLSTVSFGPRTLLFGWLCLVAELIVLERFRRASAAVLWLPPLFALWVNLHGSWVIGLTVLGVHTFCGLVSVTGEWIQPATFRRDQTRTVLFAWLGVLSALFCNPWGWRLVAYPFNLAFHQTLNIANVQEWHSLDLHSMRGRLVAAVLLLLVARQLRRPRRWRAEELALLCVGLWSAFNYSRFLFLLALLAAPAVARSFRRGKARNREEQPMLNAVLLGVVVLLVSVACRQSARAEDVGMQQFPLRPMPAITHLAPGRRLFNEFLWGGYLEWNSPGTRTFIDSRVDIFEYNGTFKDYLDIVRIQNTLTLLDKYRIDAVLFEKDTPLVYLLTHTSGWRLTYDDGRQVLLERDTPSTL